MTIKYIKNQFILLIISIYFYQPFKIIFNKIDLKFLIGIDKS